MGKHKTADAPGGTQLIPARGRKLKETKIFEIDGQTQLIPARGRKHAGGEDRAGHFGHNLSPRGDGNALM